jgi:hypothetical protein
MASVGGVATHPVGVGSNEPVALAILTTKAIPIIPNTVKANIKRFFFIMYAIKR